MTSSPSSSDRPSRRSVLSLAGLGVLGLALAGCAEEDSLARQANSGDQKGYIAGDGTVSEYPPGERGEPVQFRGTLFDGTTVSAEHVSTDRVWKDIDDTAAWGCGCDAVREHVHI